MAIDRDGPSYHFVAESVQPTAMRSVKSSSITPVSAPEVMTESHPALGFVFGRGSARSSGSRGLKIPELAQKMIVFAQNKPRNAITIVIELSYEIAIISASSMSG